MDNLIVKPVDVLGSSIMAAQDEKGRIFAGVNYFCNALGMTKGQRDKQVQKVQKDEVLKQGCFRLEAGVFDPSNEAITLRIDFIPLWLAKIVITDKTKQENPDLADKLLDYQLKAKDILAKAFLPKQDPPTSVAGQIQLLAQGNVELNKRVDDIQADLQSLKMDLPILPIEADRITNAVKAKGVSVMGGKESNAYRNRSIVNKVYRDIYRQIYRNFEVSTYKALKRNQCDMVIEIVGKYELPVVLKDQIEQCNAQQKLNLKGGE
ncbi:MAG: hypothetical protein HFG89_00210 [Dorea sp.]|jgi:hypothetical protein|nr:hypothetical protein [Dorea sp.]